MTAHSDSEHGWLCCHLGAREHYAIPRALHQQGRLRFMITDAWSRPGGLARRGPATLSRRLAERFHPALADANIRDLTASLLPHEIGWRLQGRSGWNLVQKRNAWFQRVASDALSAYQPPASDETPTVFAHSYSARRIFELARTRRWKTVLGQIDPGPRHLAIARQLSEQSPEFGPPPPEPPPEYLASWREECALADRIVVNSDWAREALARAGVAEAKLHVVPLPYEPEEIETPPNRQYPGAFTEARPLRVLFAGSISVVKGVPPLLEAMTQLEGSPVVLRLVGTPAMAVPAAFVSHRSIRWVGAVPRSEIMSHYRECDVLVFPSYSDGFGMAQVEALGHGLPVIASRFCGRAVEDGVTGIVLPSVSAEAIADAIRTVLAQPSLLAAFSRQAISRPPSSISALGAALIRVAS